MSHSLIPSTPPPRVHANANPGTPKASPDPVKPLRVDSPILSLDIVSDPTLSMYWVPSPTKPKPSGSGDKKTPMRDAKRKHDEVDSTPPPPPPSPVHAPGRAPSKSESKSDEKTEKDQDSDNESEAVDSDSESETLYLFTTVEFECRRSDQGDIESSVEEIFETAIGKLRDAQRQCKGKRPIQVTLVNDDDMNMEIYDPAEHKGSSPDEKAYARNAELRDFVTMALEEQDEAENSDIIERAAWAVFESIEGILYPKEGTGVPPLPSAEKLFEICQDTILMEISAEILGGDEAEQPQAAPAAAPASAAAPAAAVAVVGEPAKKKRKVEQDAAKDEDEEVGTMLDEL